MPNTPALQAAFGPLSDVARMRIAHAFDVSHRWCLSAMGAPLATSERELARRNMAEVRAILGPHRLILWIEDRGYPAFILWMAWDNANE